MDHQFDRRSTDANVASIAVRVGALEGRVEVLENDVRDNTRELVANTALTKQVHTNTETLVELAQSAHVLIKVGKKVAIAGKYVGFFAGGIGAVFAVGKTTGVW